MGVLCGTGYTMWWFSSSRSARALDERLQTLERAFKALELEWDEALAAEARRTAERISAALPDDLRRVFEDAAPVRVLKTVGR